MNVVFLARLYKPHVGGVEKHVEEISKILTKNHSLTIISEQHDPKLPRHQKYPEAKVYRIPLGSSDEKSKKWAIWKWIWQNRQMLYHADIIHIHDVFFWLLPVIPFLLKPRLFMTFHGYEGAKVPGLRQIFWHKLAQWLTWGNICIGDFHRKWYHTDPDIVSYGAVTVGKSRAHKSSSKAIFLGRLDVDTGFLDYIQAATELNLGLDIYGDGPLLEEAKKLSKDKPNIKFMGFVPNAAKFIPRYKYAFISRYLGILEALAAGVPVIAHFDSLIKYDYLEMAPFSEFIKKVDSPQSIIDAIHDSPATSEGYNWAIEQSWAKLADQYQLLWQKISIPRCQ